MKASKAWGAVLCGVLLSVGQAATRNVLTWQYDNARTGLNDQEALLRPANVRVGSFGKLFSRDVAGYVFAQPLYMPNVTIPGKGVHNVVYVVTERDIVYAFDADDNTGESADPLWVRSFIDPANGITSIPIGDVHLSDPPEIGTTSTPVIDADTGTMYVLPKTKEVTGGVAKYVHRLHALDITTGDEKFGGPRLIEGSVPGSGDGTIGNRIAFDGYYHFNRPALLLQDGALFIAFGTQGDIQPSHGWVMAYDAATLEQKGIWNVTPNGTLGGIWMSGAGLSADAKGFVYFLTGNGNFSANFGGLDYGDSFVRMKLESDGLNVVDYFTPFNQQLLANLDGDLGSGGSIVLPDEVGSAARPHLLVGCGKEGKIYLLDRDNMGGFRSGADIQIIQSFRALNNGGMSSPAYFNHRVYYQGINDKLRAFYITNGVFNTTPISASVNIAGFPGLTPCVSANGTNDAIVWTIQADGYNSGSPAILRAYDAYDLTTEFYNSELNAVKDRAGHAMKFTTPTVVNGKVYVPVGYGLEVYGLLQPPQILSHPVASTVALDGSVTLMVEAAGAGVLTYQWHFNGTNIAGADEPTLTLNNVGPAQSGIYTVSISNSFGSITSYPARLVVRPNAALNLYAGLTLEGDIGEVLTVQYTTSLDNPVWVNIEEVTLKTSPQLWIDTEVPANRAQRFYRATRER